MYKFPLYPWKCYAMAVIYNKRHIGHLFCVLFVWILCYAWFVRHFSISDFNTYNIGFFIVQIIRGIWSAVEICGKCCFFYAFDYCVFVKNLFSQIFCLFHRLVHFIYSVGSAFVFLLYRFLFYIINLQNILYLEYFRAARVLAFDYKFGF